MGSNETSNLREEFTEFDLVNKTQNSWCGWIGEKYKEQFKPKEIWHRFDNGHNRFYWKQTPSSNDHPNYPLPVIDIAMGITSALSVAFPESYGVKKWKEINPNWKKDLKDASDYGTLYHMACEEYLLKRVVDNRFFAHAEKAWRKGDQMRRDMAAFILFIKDYSVEPILIEGILSSSPYTHKSIDGTTRSGTSICSALDLFCVLKLKEKEKVEVGTGEFYQRGPKAGQEKTKMETRDKYVPIFALVDMKSNFFEKEEKSFFDANKRQLMFGKMLINKHFGIELDDIRIFNFSPNKWRTEPGYNLKEQVPTLNKIGYTDEYVMMNKLRGAFVNGDLEPSGTIHIFPEVFDETAPTNFMALDYEEYILYSAFGATFEDIKRIRENKKVLLIDQQEDKEEFDSEEN